MDRVPLWGAKALCGLSASPKQDARMAHVVLPEYFGCLASIRTESAAQLCAACMSLADKTGKTRKCFACLEGLFPQNLRASDLMLRGGLCAI